jgi:hypothetical protein
LALTPALADRKIHNVFVQGYYYGIKERQIPSKWSLADYRQNYYDPNEPFAFMRQIISTIFPSQVEVMDPTSLLKSGLADDLVGPVSVELLRLLERSPKATYRTKEQKEQLARTDAQLFVTALQLNVRDGRQNPNCVLGGACYVITNSSRYLRSAKKLGIRDAVSTRPQQLLTLLELVTGPKVDDVSATRLFENPLLVYAVDQVWNDVKVLLDNGVALAGKSLVRLKWDLDEALHRKIAALEQADEQAEEEDAPDDMGDREYVELFREARSLGYSTQPILDPLQRALEEAQNEAQATKIALEQLQKQYGQLETEIARFGKKKQRYLRRVTRRQSGQSND